MRLSKDTKHLKALAEAVGMKIKAHSDGELASAVYRLFDAKGEQLVLEYDHNDMIDSLKAYAGGHPGFAEALAQYNYATGEDW